MQAEEPAVKRISPGIPGAELNAKPGASQIATHKSRVRGGKVRGRKGTGFSPEEKKQRAAESQKRRYWEKKAARDAKAAKAKPRSPSSVAKPDPGWATAPDLDPKPALAVPDGLVLHAGGVFMTLEARDGAIYIRVAAKP